MKKDRLPSRVWNELLSGMGMTSVPDILVTFVELTEFTGFVQFLHLGLTPKFSPHRVENLFSQGALSRVLSNLWRVKFDTLMNFLGHQKFLALCGLPLNYPLGSSLLALRVHIISEEFVDRNDLYPFSTTSSKSGVQHEFQSENKF